MQTLKIELEDSMYQNIVHSGVDIQAKVKEFLFDLVDDGYPAISSEEAKKRVSNTVEKYRTNPESFTEFTDDYWNDLDTVIDRAI